MVLAGVWLFVAAAAAGLVYKNTPQIRNVNDDTLKKYAALMEACLPPGGGILLSDDARRTLLLQAALVRDGRAKEFLLADTAYLPVSAYHRFLHAIAPQKWPDTVTSVEATNGVSPLHLIGLLATLAKTNELYYLHPSFGYYFEQFCMEPHGLVYKLNPLPNDTLRPPKPDKNLIAANEAFWAQAETAAFAPIIQAVTPADPNAAKSFGEKMLDLFHVAREPNPNAAVAGTFYSRGLDFWGVQLQRAGDLTNAAAHFEMAQKLNPDNVVAQINLDFNRNLQAGQATPVDLSKATTDRFGKYGSWDAVLGENGPFDETSFTFKNGVVLRARRVAPPVRSCVGGARLVRSRSRQSLRGAVRIVGSSRAAAKTRRHHRREARGNGPAGARGVGHVLRDAGNRVRRSRADARRARRDLYRRRHRSEAGAALARSRFRAAFERKGRFSAYLAAVPTYVITHPTPALLGAATRLRLA